MSLEAIQVAYCQAADPSKASGMARYMKELFPYLGLQSVPRRVASRPFLKQAKTLSWPTLQSLVLALWQLPEREYHYLALDLLDQRRKCLPVESLPLIETLITTHSWWDTVDLLASHIAGGYLQRFPEQRYELAKRWNLSDNLWLQRTSLLFQLGYKEQTDVELLFDCIRHCASSNEFFLRKAIGWALREYTRTDLAAVVAFVKVTPLSGLSRRESLKHYPELL